MPMLASDLLAASWMESAQSHAKHWTGRHNSDTTGPTNIFLIAGTDLLSTQHKKRRYREIVWQPIIWQQHSVAAVVW